MIKPVEVLYIPFKVLFCIGAWETGGIIGLRLSRAQHGTKQMMNMLRSWEISQVSTRTRAVNKRTYFSINAYQIDIYNFFMFVNWNQIGLLLKL